QRKGTLNFGAYVSRLASRGNGEFMAMEQFAAAYAMEKSIDFSQVEKERAEIMEKLVASMSKSDLNDLIQVSLAFQAGQLTFGDYYNHLKNLCAKSGLDLRAHPHFDNYVR